jgi:hypothetical protein
MRYSYTDAGEWAAHSLDDSDWIWLRSGDYCGYLRGDVVRDRSGPHLGFVWSDGHRLVTDRSRGNYGMLEPEVIRGASGILEIQGASADCPLSPQE